MQLCYNTRHYFKKVLRFATNGLTHRTPPPESSSARTIMKKILIITDSNIGGHLIERIIGTYAQGNIYYVIQTRERSYEKAGPDRFKFFTFDPTSRYKLSNVLKMDFLQVMLVMDNRIDAEQTLEIIRAERPTLRVIMLDQWQLDLKDRYTLAINATDQLSARLLDYLPNVPVIAQNVGLGEGEIMEVLVPFGSAYVYRYVGSIDQTRWRIAGIYRDRKLILASPSTLIYPNDLLLLMGEPDVLISVYRTIKREQGHFPAPFGTAVYLYIDMDIDRGSEIDTLLAQALDLHEKLRRPLVIRVVNPGDLEKLARIKSHRADRITVDIEYDLAYRTKTVMQEDKVRHHSGLIMVSRKLFAGDEMRRTLFELKLPVLKLTEQPVQDAQKAVVLLSEGEAVTKMTTTLFDVASQLAWKIELIEYRQNDPHAREQVEEYYTNLATIFAQNVKITKSEENPLRLLDQRKRLIQCLPFTENMVSRPLFTYFSTDLQKLYFYLDRFPQLMIPV